MTAPIRRFLLSRVTGIFLIIAVLVAVTSSALIPQAFITPAARMLEWQAAHPLLSRVSALLGLHHFYRHPAFTLILAAVMLSMAISVWTQAATAWQRTFRPRPDTGGCSFFTASLNAEESHARVAAAGYQLRGMSEGNAIFLRNRAGYWGSPLLHLGMLLVVGGSLFVALTQQRAMIDVAEGFIRYPSDPLLKEEHGLLAQPLVLPEPLRLDRLTYRFGAGNSVSDLSSTLSFPTASGSAETKTVAINSILFRRGYCIYQGLEFGHAFLVEVTRPDGTGSIYRLQMRHPQGPETPSYNDFGDLLGDGGVLRAKYVLEAGRAGPADGLNPVLTLRLDRGGREVGRIPLLPGGLGALGGYTFRVRGFVPWSRLIVVNVPGMPLIFSGFFIICFGGLLHYGASPREVTVGRSPEDGMLVSWRAARFPGFYREEFDALRKRLMS